MTSLPELSAFGPSVRVPELRDVRLTARFRAVIDEPAMQRLRRVRQLGPTFLVYPGAVHTRFEHCLGTFGVMQRMLLSLLREPAFKDAASEVDLLTALAAALLHDVGHYPFAHSLEALHRRGSDAPRHEALTAKRILGDLAPVLERELGVDPQRVARLVSEPHTRQPTDMDAILASMLSSGVDADKIDYLQRDSGHLGVPYGRGFDVERLLTSLCISETGRRIAVAARGKIPVESFVFGRYMMFSEVYWHHTVRAVSAMVEAALEEAVQAGGASGETFERFLMETSDEGFFAWILQRVPAGGPAAGLVAALHGGGRRLHKRLITFSRVYAEEDKRAAYEKIYNSDAAGLARIEERIRVEVARLSGLPVRPSEVLIDTPPRDKDHPEPIEVLYGEVRGKRTYALSEISSVVAGVSTDFVKVVKKIRVFVAPELAESLTRDRLGTEARILEAILS